MGEFVGYLKSTDQAKQFPNLTSENLTAHLDIYDNITVHPNGIPLEVLLFVKLYSGFTPAAITIGHDIYFDAGQYHPETVQGLALIAHEVMHVFQWETLGKKEFLKQYGTSSDNPLEDEANAFETAFSDWLKNTSVYRGGDAPCKK